MAKRIKKVEYNKEQNFDELISNNWYYNMVYTYLLKFETEFSNLSLVDFIINCESSSHSVMFALLNSGGHKSVTIKHIIDTKGYYESAIRPDYLANYRLNDFELYLTKFIVAHNIVRYYKGTDDIKPQEDNFELKHNEAQKRMNYFNQIVSITERQKKDFKYYIDYCKFSERIGNGFYREWALKLNSSEYVTISKKELLERIANAKQSGEIPTKEGEKFPQVKWKKSSVLLAYLLNELKTYGYIDEENIWSISERVFVDKNDKPIRAATFTSMVKNYENNQTLDGTKGKPKAHTEITELIKLIKSVSKGID